MDRFADEGAGVDAKDAENRCVNRIDFLWWINRGVIHCAVADVPAKTVGENADIDAAAKVTARQIVNLDSDELPVYVGQDATGILPVAAVVGVVWIIGRICGIAPGRDCLLYTSPSPRDTR